MIGVLTVGQFIILCICAFAFLAIAAMLFKEAIESHARLTVEMEDEYCRGVIAYIGQHHPSIGSLVDNRDECGAFMLDDTDSRDEFLRAHGVGRHA